MRKSGIGPFLTHQKESGTAEQKLRCWTSQRIVTQSSDAVAHYPLKREVGGRS